MTCVVFTCYASRYTCSAACTEHSMAVALQHTRAAYIRTYVKMCMCTKAVSSYGHASRLIYTVATHARMVVLSAWVQAQSILSDMNNAFSYTVFI